MKLLITTQKIDINDDVLGFFHAWVAELAKYFEEITVLCLFKGEHDLPSNVRVFSLGKDEYQEKPRIFRQTILIFRFFKYVISEKERYDAVFFHMNPEYVVLGGWLFALLGKKMFLWYLHKAVDWKLRYAEKRVDLVFTASQESFRLKSGKAKIVGHGINLGQFSNGNSDGGHENGIFRIVYVGRISRIKNQMLLLEAIDILKNVKGIDNLNVRLVGAPIYQTDNDYLESMKNFTREKSLSQVVGFAGSVPNKGIRNEYLASDLAINLCPTGGMDKAVLESWASRTLCLVKNQTFAGYLAGFPELILNGDKPEELAEKIESIMALDEPRKAEIKRKLGEIVEENFSLEKLAKKLYDLMSE